MTKQEAIERYNRIRYNLLNHEDKEAVDVAFDALREQKPVTNREWLLNSTTNEVLAKAFDEVFSCFSCPAKILCENEDNKELDCTEIFADWLKQPHKE